MAHASVDAEATLLAKANAQIVIYPAPGICLYKLNSRQNTSETSKVVMALMAHASADVEATLIAKANAQRVILPAPGIN